MTRFRFPTLSLRPKGKRTPQAVSPESSAPNRRPTSPRLLRQMGPQDLFDESEAVGAAATDHFELDVTAIRAQVAHRVAASGT